MHNLLFQKKYKILYNLICTFISICTSYLYLYIYIYVYEFENTALLAARVNFLKNISNVGYLKITKAQKPLFLNLINPCDDITNPIFLISVSF